MIRRSTETPAKFLGRVGEIGTLKPGAIADISILERQSGQFPIDDSEGHVETANVHLEPTHVFRAGNQFGIVPRATIEATSEEFAKSPKTAKSFS